MQLAQLDPGTVLTPDRFLDYEKSVQGAAILNEALTLLAPNMTLCDIGGASGLFAATVARKSGVPVRASVLEVVDTYRHRMVSADVEFIHASIVDGALPDRQFDLVTARHVLHHLVGASVRQTDALQRRGLTRMLSLVKPGGYLVFQEQVLLVKPFSRIVFALSRFAQARRLTIPYFDTGSVVVSYMTPADVERAVRSLAGATVKSCGRVKRGIMWRWRLTVLMAATVDVLYVIRRD
jgi:hypothetical protein